MQLSSYNDLENFKFKNRDGVRRNLNTAELYEQALKNGEAILTNNMALRVLTGKYTGRSPKDRYIVDQSSVRSDIAWGNINQPISEEIFNKLYKEVQHYLDNCSQLYVKDMYAGAAPRYRLNVRIISEAAYHSLFAHNMFIEPSKDALQSFKPDFTVISAPSFKADPNIKEINSETFIFINFEQKIILIGGTLYSGEIKKGVFTVLNYLLPKKNVLSMHCSANMGKDGDTAIFFGLSGTGKTTLSSNPDRILIGDDEHGWSDDGVFNIEGGCYAKTINLSKQGEPLIYATTQMPGTILENIVLDDNRKPNFDDASLTLNTRCSYPIRYISNVSKTGQSGHPNNIIFLTCDAYGVLPPISKLTLEQAIYYFISGYTAKIAGTERGVTEPQATFSACFGAPFMPLHPTIYADLLAEKIRRHNSKVWLLNTGWIGGAYGVGKRIALRYTRQMLNEVLLSNINSVDFKTDPAFGFSVPQSIEGIPSNILNPQDMWNNQKKYDKTVRQLKKKFQKNFRQFRNRIDKAFIEAGPN